VALLIVVEDGAETGVPITTKERQYCQYWAVIKWVQKLKGGNINTYCDNQAVI